jgi:zinc transport system ATP-binding protein
MIDVDHLFFQYEETEILHDVTFSIKAGEFIGIFGPNGGGKTTLLKLLMGFLKPSRGAVRIGIERCEIGYVPQLASFDKQFPISVLEVVAMGALFQPSSVAKRMAKEALARVGLTGKEEEPFGALSGGQAQRALIARAIVGNPKIIFLDEPTANIDAEAETLIDRLLAELKGSITIVMVTHDLQSVMKKVDRLLCVQRRVTTFSPEKVCEHFALGLYHPPLLGGS